MSADTEIRPTDDLPTVAFKVCTALHRKGIRAILTGGSAATVYAPSVYQSSDVDFIASFHSKPREFQEALSELGFAKVGRIYQSERTTITLDFPDDEVLIGRDCVKNFATLESGPLVLHLLTPTDCVRDRLCWFFWYEDLSALRAACGVAARHPVDLEKVKDWAQREGEEARFLRFLARLEREGENLSTP